MPLPANPHAYLVPMKWSILVLNSSQKTVSHFFTHAEEDPRTLPHILLKPWTKPASHQDSSNSRTPFQRLEMPSNGDRSPAKSGFSTRTLRQVTNRDLLGSNNPQLTAWPGGLFLYMFLSSIAQKQDETSSFRMTRPPGAMVG